jgi:uncharacterized protein (TIGR01777 family)
MKILIAGGTGFIGSYISKRFAQNGVELSFVLRSKGHVQWNESELMKALEQTDILINLAGKSINCRHTAENKKLIYDSRIETTRILGDALLKCKRKPELWINASASAFYKSDNEHCQTESNYMQGDDFLAKTVQDWEKAFFSYNIPSIRQVALRTSVVLGKGGGAFQPLKMLTKFGLGGKAGSGKQYFSWIHIEDYFRIIKFVIDNKSVIGAVNTTSPEPVSNSEFMMAMRQSMGCTIGLPAPEFAIRIGARFINTEASLLLDPVRFCPELLLKSGFKFNYPNCKSAINELVN